ncbi:hypothetical protein L914_15041 [Phytophthora nicotianae]|uniref:Uncharacterized protein n=1 Tax=Phytophthora nicotianae TaxID=4792 RepID=W2MT86_PHYNI|nr:hypothetical protein L914_15041 [Phytophthora nicotianae]
MADRRYARQTSRGRSPSAWRSRSPPRWRSPSPVRYRQSPSPAVAGRYSARSQSPRHWRSPSRYRNRSTSPPPRGEMSPRRPRSRSPPANYTREIPENRRRKLLAEKVMSLETYHRLLQDPKSPWSKTSGNRVMPIPVPLASSENTGDYQQKFEFWLAQRNVTLSSLRDNVIQERNYRCGYAQWRVQMKYGQPRPKSSSAYPRQRSRSRSPERYRKRGIQKRDQYSSARPRSPKRISSYQSEPQSSSTSAPATATVGSSRFYDVRRQVSKSFIGYRDKSLNSEVCCKNCDRKWDDLNRRLKQLESVVSRIGLPRPRGTFNGRRSSRYDDFESSLIDLTEDVDMEAKTGSNATQSEEKENNGSVENTPGNQSRSVEITPTDSDTNRESPPTAEDLDEPTTEPGDELESKLAPELRLLINAYNQLNDDVLAKQKEEEKMVTDMELAIDEDKANLVKLRSQIYELRDAIKRQKDERDAAVVAIIMHTHAKKLAENKEELQKIATSGVSNEQEDLHEKCAGIAAKLAEKDKELARLQKQLRSLSSLPMNTKESDGALGEREAHELSNKIRLEQTSKASLETERQKIFTRLMKSSRQIQALVIKEITSK